MGFEKRQSNDIQTKRLRELEDYAINHEIPNYKVLRRLLTEAYKILYPGKQMKPLEKAIGDAQLVFGGNVNKAYRYLIEILLESQSPSDIYHAFSEQELEFGRLPKNKKEKIRVETLKTIQQAIFEVNQKILLDKKNDNSWHSSYHSLWQFRNQRHKP